MPSIVAVHDGVAKKITASAPIARPITKPNRKRLIAAPNASNEFDAETTNVLKHVRPYQSHNTAQRVWYSRLQFIRSLLYLRLNIGLGARDKCIDRQRAPIPAAAQPH